MKKLLLFCMVILLATGLSSAAIDIIDLSNTVLCGHTYISSYRNSINGYENQKQTNHINQLLTIPLDYSISSSYNKNFLTINVNSKVYLYDGGQRQLNLQLGKLVLQNNRLRIVQEGRNLLKNFYNTLISYWSISYEENIISQLITHLGKLGNTYDESILVQQDILRLNKKRYEDELSRYGLEEIPSYNNIIWPNIDKEILSILEHLENTPTSVLGYSLDKIQDELNLVSQKLSQTTTKIYLTADLRMSLDSRPNYTFSLKFDYKPNTMFSFINSTFEATESGIRMGTSISKRSSAQSKQSYIENDYDYISDINIIRYYYDLYKLLKRQLSIDKKQRNMSLLQCKTAAELMAWSDNQVKLITDELNVLHYIVEILSRGGYFDSAILANIDV